jgi:glutamate--cysteine ligase
LLDLARELSAIARVGLARQDVRNARGENETIYLDALDRQLALGRSPAHDIRERWETVWEERIEDLVEFTAYRIE